MAPTRIGPDKTWAMSLAMKLGSREPLAATSWDQYVLYLGFIKARIGTQCADATSLGWSLMGGIGFVSRNMKGQNVSNLNSQHTGR